MGKEEESSASGPTLVVDPVGEDSPGAREIAFAVPARYNASRILFDNLAAGRGDWIAIHCEGRNVTYAALSQMAGQFGNGLKAFGLARGERVLMLVYDTPEYAAALFGAIRAGFVPVLVNTLSPPDQIAYFLQDSGAKVACVEADLLHHFGGDTVAGTHLEHIVVRGEARTFSAASLTVHRLTEWRARQSSDLAAADTHRNEMAFWMYSSGSTGRPKGVVHLQHDMPYTYASYGKHVLKMREDDVVFSPPKIFFAYGFGNSLTFPFSAGASTVLNPHRPDAETVLNLIERCRPTILFGLPTLYNAIVNHPGSDSRDLSSLRLCISAAETLSPELFAEWQRRYRLPIVEGLGSTEVLHIYLSNSPERQKPGASGRRVPGYEVKLLDPDGQPVADGEVGIMWVRGDSSAPFYWNRPDKTRETMRDSWIFTGDRFRPDEDGFLRFDGRVDDHIKVSGQWIYPLEVERCLAKHPAVRECVVLGIADEQRLMTLQAVVALHDGYRVDDTMTRTLQEYVKRTLLPYKYPRRVDYQSRLPKTGTGKIDRQQLQAQYADGKRQATPA